MAIITAEYAALRIALGVVVWRGRVLVVQRAAPDTAVPGLGWALPGGKCRSAEPAVEAVVREVAEETGLTVRAQRTLGERRAGSLHLSYFVCETVPPVAVQRNPRELRNHAWLPGPQALARFTSDVYPPLRALLSGDLR